MHAPHRTLNARTSPYTIARSEKKVAIFDPLKMSGRADGNLKKKSFPKGYKITQLLHLPNVSSRPWPGDPRRVASVNLISYLRAPVDRYHGRLPIRPECTICRETLWKREPWSGLIDRLSTTKSKVTLGAKVATVTPAISLREMVRLFELFRL